MTTIEEIESPWEGYNEICIICNKDISGKEIAGSIPGIIRYVCTDCHSLEEIEYKRRLQNALDTDYAFRTMTKAGEKKEK